MLAGKKILIGISGSIAVYKIALLTRLLVKSEAEVQIVASKAALDFITPLTLSTLSRNPVLSEFTKNSTGEWNNHVALAEWADVILIAPASANTLAKMTNSLCDNLLLAVYLSAKCPVYFAPAMDLDMFIHPANQENIKHLQSFGNHLIPVESGELASGLEGKGRMAEPETIFEILENHFTKKQKLAGKTALVSAGPTYESIDPVRFIGNHASGKMGFALAEALAENGAKVYLVAGPSNLNIKHPNIERIDVVSAEEMFQACVEIFPKTNICIMAAAVADYTPVEKHHQKIKKASGDFKIELKRTKDILASLGEMKSEKQILMGFALETQNEIENAKAKLKKKNLNAIVLNSLNDKGAGFKHNTNKITIIDHNKTQEFELKTKQKVAEDIVSYISLV